MIDNADNNPNTQQEAQEPLTASFTIRVFPIDEENVEVEGHYSVDASIPVNLLIDYLNEMIEDLVEDRNQPPPRLH